jgi:hypothetical protein
MEEGKYVKLDNPDNTDEPLEIVKDCWLCLNPVAGNEIKNSQPTCYTCVNAHYIHNHCVDFLKEKKCGICKKAIDRYCYTRTTGLVVVPNRKGGKTKKSTKKAKKNKKSRKSKKRE